MNGLKTPTDGEQDAQTGGKLELGWVLTSALLALGSIAYVQFNQIGPHVFWSSNACPNGGVTGTIDYCGTMPLVVPAAVALGVGAAMAGVGLISRLRGDDA